MLKKKKMNKISIKREIPCEIFKEKKNKVSTIGKEISSDFLKEKIKMNAITIKKEIPSDVLKEKIRMHEIAIKKEIPFFILKEKMMNKITMKKDIPSDISKEEKMNEITIKKEIPLDNSKMKKINTVEIPSDIVFEVLTRLPIKDLGRCKCVLTTCSSMIRQPEFMKAHRACGGILIHILPDISRTPRNNISDSMKGLFYVSINGKNEVFSHRVRLPYFAYKDITPVVNGLACLYTGHQVSLFNISTLELMELPPSS
ncbi:hypothetical protein FXO37_29443 [Capsicum annuum]|nr:hypothetical protein FXO37_29443 [Capsicum annuum]